MRIRDFVKITRNKNNKQINLSIRKRVLDKEGLTIEQFLDWPKPKTKFYKK